MEPSSGQTAELLTLVWERCRVDLTGYHEALLARQIAVRLKQLHIDDPEAYIALCREDASECDVLLTVLSVNFSTFFRDPLVYELILARVLPRIIRRKRAAGQREIRIWSAGCAAGEEPYSVAILLLEALGDAAARWDLSIFATDIDRDALERARQAVYGRASLDQVRCGLLDAHFTNRAEDYHVRPEVRRLVHFSVDDLTSARTVAPPDSIFGAFDIALCRNVLIYLVPALQEKVLEKLRRALDPDGYLVLGDADAPRGASEGQLKSLVSGSGLYQVRGRAQI